MEYNCSVVPNRCHVRFLRTGFRTTATTGLLIGIITVFWQVTLMAHLEVLDITWMHCLCIFNGRFDLTSTLINWTGVSNLKFVSASTAFSWLVLATTSVKFTPAHGSLSCLAENPLLLNGTLFQLPGQNFILLFQLLELCWISFFSAITLLLQLKVRGSCNPQFIVLLIPEYLKLTGIWQAVIPTLATIVS